VWVDGRYKTDGTVWSDPAEGWRVNLGLLEEACEPASSAPWTFTAIHHLPDGDTRTAQIQVVDLTFPTRMSGVAADVTLDIVVPAGVFEYESGS
jgi:hypothetical protein